MTSKLKKIIKSGWSGKKYDLKSAKMSVDEYFSGENKALLVKDT
jgi:hypothetical protein